MATASSQAIIETEFGEITLEFFPDIAPKHVKSFLNAANAGKYDGTIFHRVIPGFMIQGGDPNTKDVAKVNAYGTGDFGYKLKAEFNDTPHKRGILSMARGPSLNSAGSQFFICVADSLFLDKQYTAFGKVVNGMDVADKIVNLPRNSKDLPDQRVEIKIRVVES